MHRYCALLLVLIAVTLGGACYSPPERPLRVGTILWPGYELLYFAQDQGFIDAASIRLIPLTSSTETMRAFRLGQLDVAALTLDEVIRLAQTESDLRVFLVLNISHGADKVIARDPIQQPHDLEGKRLALETSAVGTMMLLELLQAGQLSTEQLTLIPATIDQQLEIMQENQADAVISFDPVATKLLREGYKVIFDSRQTRLKIIDVLVTREQHLQTYPAQFAQLLTGHWQALRLLEQQPERAFSYIAPRLDVSAQELAQIYEDLIIPGPRQNHALLAEQLNTLAETIAEAMFNFGLLMTRPELDQLAEASLIESNGK